MCIFDVIKITLKFETWEIKDHQTDLVQQENHQDLEEETILLARHQSLRHQDLQKSKSLILFELQIPQYKDAEMHLFFIFIFIKFKSVLS